MSIIVDALKKAQGSLKTTAPSHGGSAPTLPPPSLRKPKIRKHIGVWIFASFLLLGGLSFHFLRAPSPTGNSALLKDKPVALKEEQEPVASKEVAQEPSHVVSEVVEETTPVLSPASVSNPIPASPVLTPAPSLPVLTLAVVSKSIDLDGIMYTPERPRAIINGGVRGEGDRIGKFTISKIEKDFVKVTSNGQEFTIHLRQ